MRTKINCTECKSCPFGGPKVNASGPLDAEIVIVGEGPGVQELRQGIPFCGPSGSLLETCFPPEVSLDDVLILNSIQCMTPSGAAKQKQHNKDRLQKAVVACKPRVLEMIGAHPRKVIITLGAWAAASVLGNFGFKVTQDRGLPKSIPHPGFPERTVVVMPCVHPAFLLRGSGSHHVFKADLAKAIRIAQGTHREEYHEPTIVDVDTIDKVTEAIAYYDRRTLVAADIETSSLDAWNGDILCLGVVSGHKEDLFNESPLVHIFSPTVLHGDPRIAEWMADKRREWIWHNGKYDCRWLRKKGIRSAFVHHDSMLLSYCLQEGQGGHDLGTLSTNLIGAPKYKHEVKQWLRGKNSSYSLLPREVLYDRNAKDLYNTAMIYHKLRDKVEQDSALWKLYTKTLIPASETLLNVELGGISTDPNNVAGNQARLEAEIESVACEFAEVSGVDGADKVNLNSPAQLKVLLYDQMGLTIKGKKPESTDVDTLEKLEGAHPCIKVLMRYRKIQKQLSTYVEPLPKLLKDDKRIHTTYKIHGTTTGRLSSAEPNVQNIPRDPTIKSMYRCDLPEQTGGIEHCLIEADLNTAELRMLAIMSEDDFLTSVFMDDSRNLHDEVSLAMYGAGFTEDQRVRAKAINFGIPYGRKAPSIAEEFSIPTSEAQDLIDKWLARAPKAADFLAYCRESPGKGRTLVTVFGRKRRPGVVSRERLDALQNEFANFPMQSTVSDICLHGAMVLQPLLPKYGARIVNLVHDSILVTCPVEVRVEVGSLMKKCMESVAPKWLTTNVQMKSDLKWGVHWGKLGKWKDDLVDVAM